ncbi:MAG: LysR substrate-binding domain-containing protein [Pseudomonadales bacterium]|nr:LysR substrate-binding domain-containing protein [Pseudomonadales bacterium]
MADFPEIEVDLDISHKRRDLVKDKYDLALRFGLNSDDEQYVAKQIIECPMFLYCSADYYRERKPKLLIKSLNEQPIVCSRAQEVWSFTNKQGEKIQQTVNSRFYASSAAFKRDAVIKGVGISLLPEFICRDAVIQGKLIKMDFDVQPIKAAFYAIYQPSHYQNPKLHRLLDYLLKGLKGL